MLAGVSRVNLNSCNGMVNLENIKVILRPKNPNIRISILKMKRGLMNKNISLNAFNNTKIAFSQLQTRKLRPAF